MIKMHRHSSDKKTLKDISELAGVSQTVISRVLNGKAEEFRINKDTVEKVLKICEREHYRPNYFAQLLRGKTTKCIGLILPRLDYQFFGELSSIIITEAYNHGYLVVTMITMEDQKREAEAIETLINRQVDGIIISPCSPSSEILIEISKGIPTVQIDRYYSDKSLSYITTDNFEGGKMAVQHLIERGHRRILCIQQGIKHRPTMERVRGALEAAKAAGNVEVTVCGNDLSRDNSYVEMMLALNSPNPPTAVFTITNSAVPGVMQAIREKGISAPDDISIITFDDSRFLDYIVPPITRIVQPIEKICTTAFRVLNECINEKKSCEAKLFITPTIVTRESVRHIGH